MELDTIVCGDCLEVMSGIPDDSIALTFADPPHNKNIADWDNGHDWRPWIPEVVRITKPNGAIWVDHSNVSEVLKISEYIVKVGGAKRTNFIVWDKFNVNLKDKWAFNGLWDSPSIRSWPQMAEYLIYHASEPDWSAIHTAGSSTGTGHHWDSLRLYLKGELDKSGLTQTHINGCLNSQMSGHYFGLSQWALPTRANYEKLRNCLNSHGNGDGPYLIREWEDLRKEWEDLRKEWEDKRYTFNGPPGCGSVWSIPAWNHEADWHPTPKPLSLLERIIRTTSKPGDLVFDPFIGSGTTAVVALKTNRHYYGCDNQPSYIRRAIDRIEGARLETAQLALSL